MDPRYPTKEALSAYLPHGTKAKLEEIRIETGCRSLSAAVTFVINERFEKISAS